MRARRGAKQEIAPMPAIRHAILGAGGVGGLIGACLARSGALRHVGGAGAERLQQYPKQLRWKVTFGNFTVAVARVRPKFPRAMCCGLR